MKKHLNRRTPVYLGPCDWFYHVCCVIVMQNWKYIIIIIIDFVCNFTEFFTPNYHTKLRNEQALLVKNKILVSKFFFDSLFI